MKTKYSYGIICIRFNYKKNVKEVLMVKKRTTYSFEKIISGAYRIQRQEMQTICSKTTIEEKLEILSGDFDKNWKKIYLNLPDQNDRYYQKYLTAKEKYYRLLDQDDGLFIKNILENVKSVSTLWDFTKGRKYYRNELDLDTAIREFSEETYLDIKNIMFIPQYHKSHIISTNTVLYKSKLFLAIEKNTIESSSNIPEIYLRNSLQVHEITQLKWLSLNELVELDVLNRLAPTVKNFMKEVKKKYNNAKVPR